jgi:hypothetical protein
MAGDFDGARMHDARLVALASTWDQRASDVSIRFVLVGGSHAELRVGQLRSLWLQRNEPWGPSVFVNDVRVFDSDASVRVAIEMQSGDLLELEGSSIEWLEADEPSGRSGA